MSDTSLVFALSADDNTGPGMRSARETVNRETEGMADDVAANGSKMGTALAAAGAAAGALAGAAIMSTLSQAMDVSEASTRLEAQLVNTTADVGAATDAMTNVFTDGWGESATEVGDAVRSVTANMDEFTGQQDELEDMTKKTMALSKAFDQDLAKATAAAGQMVKTGMADSFDEAMDLLAVGLSGNANKADDLLDTFNEYPTLFRRVGLDGATAMGLISQGIEAGAKDADAIADAIGIFGEMALAGGKAVDEAFESIGLNGEKIGQQMRAGGDQATQALQDTMDALRATDDETVRLTASQALFGDLANTQADALWALDPASAAAAGGFDDVAGAADKVVEKLEDSPAMRMEAFKRGVQQNVIDFLGGTVLPAVTGFTGRVREEFASVWEEAGQGGTEGIDRVADFFLILGQRIGEKIVMEVAPRAIEGLVSAGQRIAEWVMANPTSVLKGVLIAGAISTVVLMLPALVAAAVVASAGLVIWGFVDSLITATEENAPRWWASFTGWVSEKAGEAGTTFNVLGDAISFWFAGLWSRYIAGPVSRQWTSFTDSVGALPGQTWDALSALGPVMRTRAWNAFQSMKDAAINRAVSLVSWTSGLPEDLAGALGSQGYRLYNAGLDFVYGIWDGISAGGGWLWSQIQNFASSYIVDPVIDLLDIRSPSKLAADEIGHWIPAGIAMGVEDNADVVDQAMRNVVDPAAYRPATTALMPGVAPLAGTAASPQPGRMVVEFRGGSRAFREFFQECVRLDAGGDVVRYAEG
ncbi:phage tail tape measure protein [Streptomyces sp. NPDC006997]|uniref:phage tail tape measure protein n=1 Tax=Streptomyces sp. NPDC006997 TaxID=3155356 RepID=UPI0033DF1068